MANLLRQSFSTGWDQALHRSALQNALHSKQLIRHLFVDEVGHIDVQVCEWEDYWCAAALDSEMRACLDRLRVTREVYIDSGYELNHSIPYCQTYFAMLRRLLAKSNEKQGLRALIGLECFCINWRGSDGALAAGAVTIRHPVYLLAKLREPKAYEDAKFLPIICPTTAANSVGAPQFFYYRQIKIQNSPFASLLIYPLVDLSRRLESFACIDAVSSALRFKPDPRSKPRAKTIAEWAVAPFLRHQQSRQISHPDLSFIDIGGGSGALLSEICKQLVRVHRRVLSDRKFTWSIVDVSLQDATRRTHSQELRLFMSYIDYQPLDYAEWILQEVRADPRRRDVALICRLLNNFSGINIEASSDSSVVFQLTQMRKQSAPDVFHPADCLGGPSPACGSLVASNSRVRLNGGTTFRQASLNDYFRGLHRIRDGRQIEDDQALFFPIRRFNEEALLLPDGTSMLDRLSSLVDLIVIEDVDLHAGLLVEHLRKNGLDHLAASDATDRVRMQVANLLCITRRELEAALPGRRIW